MKKLDVVATESFLFENQKNVIPGLIFEKLYLFLSTYYHLADKQKFLHLIVQPEEKGELTVLYGINEEIAGFTRTYRQSMSAGKKLVTTYVASMFLNPAYTINPTVTNSGLTEAINYKLAHPQEELNYVVLANNPFTYEFIAQLTDSLYPKAGEQVPEQIISIISALKKHNGWVTTGQHPMVINSPLVPNRSELTDFQFSNNETSDFYLETNPDYMQGNSLLIFMPLHLANISYGLSHAYAKANVGSKNTQQRQLGRAQSLR